MNTQPFDKEKFEAESEMQFSIRAFATDQCIIQVDSEYFYPHNFGNYWIYCAEVVAFKYNQSPAAYRIHRFESQPFTTKDISAESFNKFKKACLDWAEANLDKMRLVGDLPSTTKLAE